MGLAKSGTEDGSLASGAKLGLVRPQIESLGSLPGVLRAFKKVTGRPLRYLSQSKPHACAGGSPGEETHDSPVDLGDGSVIGSLKLEAPGGTRRDDPAPTAPPVSFQDARSLASSLADMLGELMGTRVALWRREAELAAGVPLVPVDDESGHLAMRLEAALRGGAEAVGCHAAAIYLLDAATTELKLRSCYGLPLDRLLSPPRSLGDQLADLEAMLGHAIVLSESDAIYHWKPPEDFPAAICVPLATPSSILGTLWVFSNDSRDFSDRETNVVEVVAGRIAADLEREMLLRAGHDGARLKSQMADAQRLQRNQLPAVSPMHEDWQFAGSTNQCEYVGGDFFDWYCLPNGRVALAVADAMHRGLEASLMACALKATLRAHAKYVVQAEEVLRQANLTLWTGSGGDQFASVLMGLLEMETGYVDFSVAGEIGAVHLRQDSWVPLGESAPLLGRESEPDYDSYGCEIEPGQALILFTDGIRDARDSQGRAFGAAGVAKALADSGKSSAEAMVERVRRAVDEHTGGANQDDRTILVIRRAKG